MHHTARPGNVNSFQTGLTLECVGKLPGCLDFSICILRSAFLRGCKKTQRVSRLRLVWGVNRRGWGGGGKGGGGGGGSWGDGETGSPADSVVLLVSFLFLRHLQLLQKTICTCTLKGGVTIVRMCKRWRASIVTEPITNMIRNARHAHLKRQEHTRMPWRVWLAGIDKSISSD